MFDTTLLNMILYKLFFVYFLLVFSAIQLPGQTDTLPAVLKVYPQSGEAYEPIFSPFCADHCWLSGHEFDLSVGRYMSTGEQSCLPPLSIRFADGSDPKYVGREPLRWFQDPYDSRYCWTYDYHRDHISAWENQRDTLFIYRFDRVTQQQKAIRTLTQAEMLIGKSGIWVTSQDGIVLYDKQSGKELAQIKDPFDNNLSLWLHNWGADVVISDRLIYRVKTGKIEPFFPLPSDMEGCKSPEKVEFYHETAISSVNEGNSDLGFYMYVPNRYAIKLPLKSYNHDPLLILTANTDQAWMMQRDTLWSYNLADGSLNAYPMEKCEPMNGVKADGRFLAFSNEKGLIFFDKYTCEFRVIPMPYGYKKPYSYYSSGSKILLFYFDEHWELVTFNKLDRTFKATDLQIQYDDFAPEIERFNALPQAFSPRYEAFIPIKDQYSKFNNQKINEQLAHMASSFSYTLYIAADSVLERVALDFASGKLDTILRCPVTKSLFNYYAQNGALSEIQPLLINNAPCVKVIRNNNRPLIEQINRTLYRLDSIAGLSLAPDERLFATGKIWMEYCLTKRWTHFSDPYIYLEQAFDYYRNLIKKYPDSRWVDNAVYDMMYYIDYYPQDSSDPMPESDQLKAIEAFKQFLIDYPDSDCKPQVLHRMLKSMNRLASYHAWPLDEVQAYIDTLNLQYPDYAQKNEVFRIQYFVLNRRWNERWNLLANVSGDTVSLEKPVKVEIRLINTGKAAELLDTSFLNHWNAGLIMHLSQIVTQGCDSKWGNFPLSPESSAIHRQAIEVPVGGKYSEWFVLGTVSRNLNDGGGHFTPRLGESYEYNIELVPLGVPWLRSSGNRGHIYFR